MSSSSLSARPHGGRAIQLTLTDRPGRLVGMLELEPAELWSTG